MPHPGEAIERIWALMAERPITEAGYLFERITESFYSKIVRPGDGVIDGGAHTGRHTIPLARLVGDAGRVLAFEPLPEAFARLQTLLISGGLSERVGLRPDALADTPGQSAFYAVNNMPEYSGLYRREFHDIVADQIQIDVSVQTIDSALADLAHRPLTFIKLDLEGGEFAALRGAESTLTSQRPCCVFENSLSSGAHGYDRDDFFGYFDGIGYKLYDIFGSAIDAGFWHRSGLFYFVALPRSREAQLLPSLWASVFEEFLSSSWSPLPTVKSIASDFEARIDSNSTTIGFVDRISRGIDVRGWAGDSLAGLPAPTVVVTVDRRPVAASRPRYTRHDVVAVTGQVGLTSCGFELSVASTEGQRVEVYAETNSGRFVKLPVCNDQPTPRFTNS